MKRKVLPAFLILALMLAACVGGSSSKAGAQLISVAPNPADAVRGNLFEQFSGKTAFQYLRDERVYSGINLGNTLDSHSGGIAGETSWGNPQINRRFLNGVKAAGFDIVRIPVTWMGHIGGAPDYRVSSSRLARVADVVEMAHDVGLKVIINLHHDAATQSGGSDLGWLSISQATRNRDNAYNLITTKFIRVWQQISAYFKNYGEWLIFEGFNELHDGNWQTCNDFRQYMTLNSWNKLFVETVRASGANNSRRFLMVNAYCADNEQALSTNFVLPEDPAEGKLIVAFHYYSPSELTINGTRSTWGTDTDRRRVDNDFSPFKQRFIDRNIPVIVGECGAVLQLYPNDAARQTQARQSRVDYISYVFSMAKRNGLIPIYWENGLARGNGEKFGLFDRNTGQPNSQDSGVLITIMTNAVRQ